MQDEVSVPGMALRGFVFKKVPVTAPHVCDITCERETICQSYNYVKAAIKFVTKMQTAPILLGFIIAPAKKDLLGMDACAQVN